MLPDTLFALPCLFVQRSTCRSLRYVYLLAPLWPQHLLLFAPFHLESWLASVLRNLTLWSSQSLSEMSSIAPSLDLTNIQGDILYALPPLFIAAVPYLTAYPRSSTRLNMPKMTQTYVFFQITNTHAFRTALSALVPIITSTDQVLGHHQAIAQNKQKAQSIGQKPQLLDISSVNIAFSQTGLTTVRAPPTLTPPCSRTPVLIIRSSMLAFFLDVDGYYRRYRRSRIRGGPARGR